MNKRIIWTLVVALIVSYGVFPQRSLAETDRNTVTPVPVIFIHGYNDNGDSWKNTTFNKWLEQTYTETYSIDYGGADKQLSQNDITAPAIYERIDTILNNLPKDKPVDIVVHSMGGLLTRYYLLQKMKNGNDAILKRIRKVIFIQTPNHGSLQAFGGRLMNMVEHKDNYFDFSDPQIKTRYEMYKDLYKEYSAAMRKKVTWKHMSYEHWLIRVKHSKLFDQLVEWGKPENSTPLGNKQDRVGTAALDGALQDRYTRAFQEYALMMAARLDVRSGLAVSLLHEALITDKIYDVQPHDTDVKPYPNKDFLDNALSAAATGDWHSLIPWYGDSLKGGVEERAIDRLLLENFYVFDAIRDDGRQVYRTVTANPFLRDLNKQEANYREGRIHQGLYVPQYVTVASKTEPHVSSLVFNLFNIGVWGITAQERDNDLVVPVSSVSLPALVLDQTIYLPQTASHTSIGPLVGLRDQKEVLQQLFLNPLTGLDDRGITLSLAQDQPLNYTSNLMRIVPSTVAGAGSYKLEISAEQSELPTVYFITRDHNQMWTKLKQVEMRYDQGTFRGIEEVKPNNRDGDYIVVSVNRANGSKAGAITLAYTPSGQTEGQSDVRPRDYQIELIDSTSVPVSSWVTQQFRVIDTRTGQSVNDLHYSDFQFTDSGHSFEKGPQYFSVKHTKVESGDNVLLNLDYSSSMNGWPILQSMNAAEDFISGMKNNVNVAVMGFANQASMLSRFTQNYKEAAKAPFTDQITGGTALYDSVKAGIDELSSQSGNKTLLVMTDGMDSGSETSIDEAIQHANDAHVHVYAVGLGNEVDHAGLDRLTGSTGGRVFYTYDPKKLATIYNKVYNSTETVYSIMYPLDGNKSEQTFSVHMTAGRSNNLIAGYTSPYVFRPSIWKTILLK